MNNQKFKPIPQSDFNITFKMEEQSISEWLIHLSNYDGKEACLQTLLLLQAINKAKLDVKTKTRFLNIVHDYLTHFIGSLINPCWDVGFPLTFEEREYAEAITWNYLTLGESFFNIAKEADKKVDELFSLYAAIKYFGQAQLHIAAIYCFPSDGFWQTVYQIYAHAEKRKLLDDSINKLELKNVTINILFKQILVFQICDTNQYRPRDMRTIFNFLFHTCNVVSIQKKTSYEQGLFLFDLSSDNPSINFKKSMLKQGDSIRYFSPVILASNILNIIKQGDVWTGVAKSINTSLFLRVVKTLEQTQKRKYDRTHNHNKAFAVIGFYHIICFLRNVTPETANLPHLKEQIVNKLKLFSDNPIEPKKVIAFERDNYINNDTLKNKLFNDSTNITEPSFIKELTILDNSVKGYSVNWDQTDFKVQIGDVFGLILGKTKKRLEIALIRRITMISPNDYKFGAEVIGFESEVVYISHNKEIADGCWGVLVLGIMELNEPDTLLYPINRFKTGDKIYLFRKKGTALYLLTKELHSTISISHVELNFLENMEPDQE